MVAGGGGGGQEGRRSRLAKLILCRREKYLYSKP
jgi:hypothetical protein